MNALKTLLSKLAVRLPWRRSCPLPEHQKDLAGAVAELHRVVRPGGETRFAEHVASEHPLWKALQRTADATVWPTISGGCHLGRDTGKALDDGGFRIERFERFVFSVSALDPP
ncbi:MAG: hypothetical protein NVS4B6_03250 [Mycobacterium sp.]